MVLLLPYFISFSINEYFLVLGSCTLFMIPHHTILLIFQAVFYTDSLYSHNGQLWEVMLSYFVACPSTWVCSLFPLLNEILVKK